MDNYRSSSGADNPDLVEVADMVWPDEHDHCFHDVFGSDGVVERVEDRLVLDTVAVDALGR